MYSHLNKLVWKLHILAAIYFQFIIVGMLLEKAVSTYLTSTFELSSLVIGAVVANLYMTTFIISYLIIYLFCILIAYLLRGLNYKTELKIQYINKVLSFCLINLSNFLLLSFLPLLAMIVVLTIGLYIPNYIYNGLTGSNAFFAPIDAMNLFFNYQNVFKYGFPIYIVVVFTFLLIYLISGRKTKLQKSKVELLKTIKK